jgi:hypothetical protein
LAGNDRACRLLRISPAAFPASILAAVNPDVKVRNPALKHDPFRPHSGDRPLITTFLPLGHPGYAAPGSKWVFHHPASNAWMGFWVFGDGDWLRLR